MEEAAANAGDQDGDGRYKSNTLVTMEIYYTISIETILQMVDNQMNNIFVYNATFNHYQEDQVKMWKEQNTLKEYSM